MDGKFVFGIWHIDVHDPYECHALDRMYLHAQGHSAHIPKTFLWTLTLLLSNFIWMIFHKLVDQKVHYELSQGLVNVKAHTQPKSVSFVITPYCHIGSGYFSQFSYSMGVSSWPFDKRSYLHHQGHSVHIPKICVQAITPYCRVKSWYFTKLLFMTKKCVMTLSKVLSPRTRSHIKPKMVSGL